MKRVLLILLCLVLIAQRAPGTLSGTTSQALTVISGLLPPCEVRILLDRHTEYDINTVEIERLLRDNGFRCPYTLDVIIWDRVELERILFRDGKVTTAQYTPYLNGHHMISAYLVDVHFEDAPNHDFSVVNTLSGAEWGTWVILHELGHMLQSRSIWGYIRGVWGYNELEADQFADENYEHYSIIELQYEGGEK